MKVSAGYLVLGALLGQASANIIFNKVAQCCDSAKAECTGCLRGQQCGEDGSYVNTPFLYLTQTPTNFGNWFRCISGLSLPLQERAPQYSTNGQCGPANGNLLCDPNSTVYTVSQLVCRKARRNLLMQYQGTCCSVRRLTQRQCKDVC